MSAGSPGTIHCNPVTMAVIDRTTPVTRGMSDIPRLQCGYDVCLIEAVIA